MTNLTVLYVTDALTSRLHDAEVAQNWELFCPASISEALAMTVFYTPHAIVVDGDSPWLNEFTEQLIHSTGPSARMHDIVVRLADAPLMLDIPNFMSFQNLPADTAPEALADTLITLDEERFSETRADAFITA